MVIDRILSHCVQAVNSSNQNKKAARWATFPGWLLLSRLPYLPCKAGTAG